MTKLILSDIKKIYRLGNEIVAAVSSVSLRFRQSEFVSILGPSGCGKTTLLNVIGGLDQYDSGDLIINGLSTKKFKNADWDAYRNRSIGFVFQNYNLISHQTVLHNVEISMTLSGISVSERKRRAFEALRAVGLTDQIKKKPAQMSGGQMQRVAIARALVNNPDIILADEPTGALDSHTSEQVMDILKEISKTRLVIMVTHNSDLANKYASRIIRMLDGEIMSDSHPLEAVVASFKNEDADNKTRKLKKTSMSMTTATSLSFKNLLTKKGRTLITSFAGSIGIIGVALVLALSGGLSAYIETMQSDTLAGFPITITRTPQTIMVGPSNNNGNGNPLATGEDTGKFSDDPIIYSYDSQSRITQHTNDFTEAYLDYIAELPVNVENAVNNISYTRGIGMNVLGKGADTVVLYSSAAGSDDSIQSQAGAMMGGSGGTFWQEMPDNVDYILSLYELIGENSRMPENKHEVLIVVDEYNRIDRAFFEKLGISSGEDFLMTDLIGNQLLTVVPNDEYYTRDGDLFISATNADYEQLYNSENGVRLTVTGILRVKKEAATSYFSEGFVYTPALTDYIVQSAQTSEIALTQTTSDINVMTGVPFANDDAKKQILLLLGADTTPTGISIYPRNFESKEQIKAYLDAYNDSKPDVEQIIYTDMAEMITSMTGTLLDTVSYVLIGFAAISLLVSTIMIAIITYVSVIERTKEIGILRAVGARKKDISSVFNAETMIIGLTAGMFGIGMTYLLSIPINIIIDRLVGINSLALLSPVHAIMLILGSIMLTLIAGFIPSRMAAEKDPVEALRTE